MSGPRLDRPGGRIRLQVRSDRRRGHVVQRDPVDALRPGAARSRSRWPRNKRFTRGLKHVQAEGARRSRDLTVQRRVQAPKADRRYYFRFIQGRRKSKTRHVPAPRRAATRTRRSTSRGPATPMRSRCKGNSGTPYWNNFDVFRRMRAEGNDFNIHLGDTIYSDSEVPNRQQPVALTREAEVDEVQDQPGAAQAPGPAPVGGLLLALGRPRVRERLRSQRELVLERAERERPGALQDGRAVPSATTRRLATRAATASTGPAGGARTWSCSSSTSGRSAPRRRTRAGSATTRPAAATRTWRPPRRSPCATCSGSWCRS